jgi:beta-glucanase (GH16 family)
MRPILAAALLLLLASPAAAQTAPDGYRLVWADEFDAPGLPDPDRWTYDTARNKDGWWNDEAQYYSAAHPENARVEDGRLKIEARLEALDPAAYPDWGGQQYTSARLLSATDWTYGVFEARAKLPCGRGSWPAVWMLPTGATEWPLDGEIDIMEHVGHDPGVVHGTAHTDAYNHIIHTQKEGIVPVPDACDAFHVYGVTWTADYVAFAIDGVEYYRFDNDQAGVKQTWPFDRPFHLILNLAVGGFWGGAQGIDDAAFPQQFEIDWVRVYQPAA